MVRVDVSSGETSIGSSCLFRVWSRPVVPTLGVIRHCVNFLDNCDLLNQFDEYKRLSLCLFEFGPKT